MLIDQKFTHQKSKFTRKNYWKEATVQARLNYTLEQDQKWIISSCSNCKQKKYILKDGSTCKDILDLTHQKFHHQRPQHHKKHWKNSTNPVTLTNQQCSTKKVIIIKEEKSDVVWFQHRLWKQICRDTTVCACVCVCELPQNCLKWWYHKRNYSDWNGGQTWVTLYQRCKYQLSVE